MSWIIQLCVNRAGATIKSMTVSAALVGVDLTMWVSNLISWCRKCWIDRWHMLRQLQIYMLTFMMMSTERPPAEILWAGVTTEECRYGIMYRRTRDFTDPMRAFYSSCAQTGPGIARWTLSYEQNAVSVQMISRIGRHLKLSNVDILNDMELCKNVELPMDVNEIPSVLLETLPGIEFDQPQTSQV